MTDWSLWIFFLFSPSNSLPVFLYIKPPDETTLGELLPNEMIWTEGLGGSKEAYLKASDKLIQMTDGLYILQKSLMETLLQNNDNDGDQSASSRKIFVNKWKRYVRENSLEQQVSDPFVNCSIAETHWLRSKITNSKRIGTQNFNFCNFCLHRQFFRPFTFSRDIMLYQHNRQLHCLFYAFCWTFYVIYSVQKQKTKLIAYRHGISSMVRWNTLTWIDWVEICRIYGMFTRKNWSKCWVVMVTSCHWWKILRIGKIIPTWVFVSWRFDLEIVGH